MKNRNDLIDAGEGLHFDAYVAIPDAPNGHAVIVLQEIFGVTPHIRVVADRFAAAGYLAVAPDLFWRVEPGLSLTHSKEDMARAFSILGNFSEDQAMQDVAKTLAHIKALPGFAGRVAVAGLCLGGKLAYLAAARMPLDASIAFYGVGIEKNLAEAAAINCPMLMFFGGLDKYVSPDSRAAIQGAIKDKKNVEMIVYADADHGFYTRGEAATVKSAHERSLAFLDESLAPGRRS